MIEEYGKITYNKPVVGLALCTAGVGNITNCLYHILMYLSYRWSMPSNYTPMVFSQLPTSLMANLQSPYHLFSILKPARNLLLLMHSLQISGNMPPQLTSKLPPIFPLAAGQKSLKAPRLSRRRFEANMELNHRSLTSPLMNQKTNALY